MKEKKQFDVSILDSPWGCLEIKYSERGIYSIHMKKKTIQKVGKNEKEPLFVKECRNGLQGYFKQAKKKMFRELYIDYSGYTPFQRNVLEALSKVDVGMTMSYEELAKKSGSPKGARAIGHVMSLNRTPIILPCHRIVRKDGGMGGYAYGVDWKKKLLEHEGIFVQ